VVGFPYWLSQSGSGFKGTGGNLHSRFAFSSEFNYVRPRLTFDRISATASFYQAGSGARIYIPFRHEGFQPYVPVIGGCFRGKTAFQEDGVEFVHEWQSGAYLGAGFGTDIAISGCFGLRPEFRYFREFWHPQYGQSSQNNGLRVMVGVYYQFGGR
jgi:hypothetical protein